ncbi:hypothetical protein PUF88_04940 [Lactobacillaceae bacterium L1_55_11]|nr:hypothetical protein [Lactobacillaceae bacterium L1_55_11]
MDKQEMPNLDNLLEDLKVSVAQLPTENDFAHHDQGSNVRVVEQAADAERSLFLAARSFQERLLENLECQTRIKK